MPEKNSVATADKLNALAQVAMSYSRACAALGNGDSARGKHLLFMIARRIEEARIKHPVFAEGVYQGVSRVTSEHEELLHAALHESEARQLDEALDVIAVSVRFANKEYLAAFGK